MMWGAIAAINQSNIKRLLAYSSIGHIGYILIGLAASNEAGIKGSIIYLFVYILMNVSIFAILLSIKYKNQYIEKIEDMSGLSKIHPIISLCVAIIMLSMAGVPPFAGFFGKFYIFISAVEANLYFLAIIGVLSSVISAFYYLRIIKVIYFDDLKENDYLNNISNKSFFVLLLSMFIIIFFIIYPTLIINFGSDIAIDFFNN